jgi:hypothetical protein
MEEREKVRVEEGRGDRKGEQEEILITDTKQDVLRRNRCGKKKILIHNVSGRVEKGPKDLRLIDFR